jgi:hypothetical protein
MRIDITKQDIDYALAQKLWDFGNDVLCRLCREYPKHDQDNVIAAKIWLIGRSYAAAIERRKDAEGSSDLFYETTVVESMRSAGIDDWLADLPEQLADVSDLSCAIRVHKHLLDVFYKITKMEKRSLASKYLHFHRPEVFFIYDSRARNAIGAITPRLKQIVEDIKAPTPEIFDKEYHFFCLRAIWLQKELNEKFGRKFTPRELDKILLRIAAQDRMVKKDDLQSQNG